MMKSEAKIREKSVLLQKNSNAVLDEHEVTFDFEIAAIEALKSRVLNANIGYFVLLPLQVGEKVLN